MEIWKNEPDRLQWIDESTGLDCLIVRNSMGALCGYVGLPENHPDYERKGYGLLGEQKHCDEIYTAHGGISYADHCQGHICHQGDVANKKVWWIGFDCSHAGDLIPESKRFREEHGLTDMMLHETYKDIEYVKSECQNLAMQAFERSTQKKENQCKTTNH